jgi:hypothetical protein
MKRLAQVMLMLVTLVVVSCQSAPAPGYAEMPHVVQKRQALQQKLLSLLPASQRTAAAAEATWLADTAYKAAAAIARYNDPVFVNWLNNRAVNTRHNYRHRGLCWHYQHDLYRELRRRRLQYFELGCCLRDQGRGAEHHVVYIKSKAGSWPSIVMLDAWWSAGRLRVDDESKTDGWMDSPATTRVLNTIYPAGHNRPIEHWSMVRTGTKYRDYIYSDLPAARSTTQWKYMQEQIKKGLKERQGKAYSY